MRTSNRTRRRSQPGTGIRAYAVTTLLLLLAIVVLVVFLQFTGTLLSGLPTPLP